MIGYSAHRRRERPAPQRTWDGPLFGREPESSDAYLARLAALATDSGTHLYLDTSFLMLLAKLGPEARRQFLEWCGSIGSQRVHVPLWTAHEFFKHRLQDTVAKELATDISRFDTAAKQLYTSLQIYASDQLFGFENSGRLMVGEFLRTVQPLRAILKLAAKSKATTLGVQEVAAFIDAFLLSGPLDELIGDVEEDERVRNRGSIPPGFKDAHKRSGAKPDDGKEEKEKGDNSFGDLVFWREVLRHAKRVRAGALVVVTKDRKNDWYENYQKDAGLTPAFRKRIAHPLSVPTPHPLLVREAHDLGAGSLDLIDPMYCGVLLEQAGAEYAKFASAVLNAELPEPEANPKVLRGWAKRFGPAVRVLGAERRGEPPEEPDEDLFDGSVLTAELLRAPPFPSAAAAPILRKVAEGNLAERIEAFDGLTVERMLAWEAGDLVALGRLVTGLAAEGVGAADEFLAHLRDLGPEMPAAVRTPLYFGALAAVYIGPGAEPRAPTGGQGTTIVLDMSTAAEMEDARARLASVLDELGVAHTIESVAPIDLEIVVEPAADNKSPADLLAIKREGVDLITLLQDEEPLRFSLQLGRDPGAFDVQVGALVDVVARFHRLPRQLIRPSVNIDAPVKVPEFAGVELDV